MEFQKFYHRLIELREEGHTIEIKESHKNYSAYTISKTDGGNAKYSDCVIMYNGDKGCGENEMPPEDVDMEEIMEDLEAIIEKMDKVFE